MALPAALYEIPTRLYGRASALVRPERAWAPLYVALFPSFACNLRCRMCYFQGRFDQVEEKDLLTLEDYQGLFETLPRRTFLSMVGGEPLLHPKFPELLSLATRRHKVGLITNGTILPPARLQLLLDHRAKSLLHPGLSEVSFSIHGPAEVHDRLVAVPGAYAKTLEAARAFREARERLGASLPVLTVRATITGETHATISRVYEAAREVGADLVSISLEDSQEGFLDQVDGDWERPTPVPQGVDIAALRRELDALLAASRSGGPALRFSGGGTPSEILAYYEGRRALSRYSCTAVWHWAFVLGNGEVFVCPRWKAGSLKEGSWDSLWNGPRSAELRLALAKRGALPMCAGCCGLRPR